MNRDTEFRDDLRQLLPRLRRFAHMLTGSTDYGDDVVQDAIVKALRHQDQFQPGTRLDSWMFKIVRNTWIEHARRHQRAKLRFSPLDEALLPASEDGRTRFADLLTLNKVRDAMSDLSDDERAALTLVALEGFSYQEAADALEIPIGTIMSRVARARRRLSALVDPPAAPDGKA